MNKYVKKIEATGLHGCIDINCEFNKGVNLVYGMNGTGKTTLLHILANALNCDFSRFEFIDFKSINIHFENDKAIQIFSRYERDRRIVEAFINQKRIYISKPKSDKGFIFSDDTALTDDELPRWLVEDSELNELEDDVRHSSRIQKQEYKPIILTAYYPAFRSMVEAWIASTEKKAQKTIIHYNYPRSNKWNEYATEMARNWFGQFIPAINFPSLLDIEMKLEWEIDKARRDIFTKDQELLHVIFVRIIRSLSLKSKISSQKGMIISDLNNLFSRLEKIPFKSESHLPLNELHDEIQKMDKELDTDTTAIRILQIYRDILKDTVSFQERSFLPIDNFLSTVNEFLVEKSLVYNLKNTSRPRDYLSVSYNKKSSIHNLRALSSGERQILALLYAASHIGNNDIVLIDEPEISLHVDWQQKLISKMASLIGERQIIACTHSPSICANHLETMVELSNIK